jgi:hypothetical protein
MIMYTTRLCIGLYFSVTGMVIFPWGPLARDSRCRICPQPLPIFSQRTGNFLLCTLYLVPCALYLVPCTLFLVPCALYLVLCALCLVPCALCLVPCALCLVPCTLYLVPCKSFLASPSFCTKNSRALSFSALLG